MDNLRYSVPNESEVIAPRQLFSYPMCGLIFLAVVAVLVALFPGQRLIHALGEQAYISDVELRYSLLLLARSSEQAIRHKDIKKQPAVVLGILGQGLEKSTTEMLWVKYIVLKTIFYEPKLPKEVKAEAITVMKKFLDELMTRPRTISQNKLLAADALSIDNSAMALVFYEQILKEQPNQSIYFYARVAATALWAKQCTKSAEYYFMAQQRSVTLDDKRYFFIKALKGLFQCNEYELALQLAAKNIDGLKHDALTYQILTDLAIKADKPAKAKDFVLKLLELREAP